MVPQRNRLQKQYYKDMLHHGAHALYYPPLSSEFKPGSCGYFDDNGDWNPIVADLSDSAAVTTIGLKPISAVLQPRPVDRNIQWGPKRSSAVIGKKLNLSTSVSIPDFPVEVKSIFEYWSQSDSGSILLTASPVTKQGFFHERVFAEWVHQNTVQLSKTYPELLKHDLWVITTTFSTKHCSHIVWSDPSKKVHVGFEAKAAGVGGMGPAGTFYEEEKDDEWEKYGTETANESRVPLFTGQSFSFRKGPFSRGVKSKLIASENQNVYRSGEDGGDDGTTFVPLNDEEVLKVTCTTVFGLEEDSSQ